MPKVDAHEQVKDKKSGGDGEEELHEEVKRKKNKKEKIGFRDRKVCVFFCEICLMVRTRWF